MKKFKALVSILIALATAAALTACSGAANETTTGSAGSTGASTGRKESNSVVVGIQAFDGLDPHNATSAGTREVLYNVYEGLVRITSTGDLEAAVASEYTVADDASSILFTIRDGIEFWDGTPVTAQDIIFSIERYADIQNVSAFSIVESIEAVGDDQVRIDLSKPSSEFIYNLNNVCAIIPASYDEKTEEYPQGTGPFKYVSYEEGVDLVVEKNENYWKENCPYLDKVTFRLVPDADIAVQQLNSGSLDIYQYLSADQCNELDKSMFNVVAGSVNMVQALYLNNAVEPFDDPLVRQAIYYAIDRDEINDFLFEGQAHIIGTNMIPAMSKYYDESLEDFYTLDTDKARELLAQAGYENGFTFTIQVPSIYPLHVSTAEIIKADLEKIGVNAEIQKIEWETWLSDVYSNRQYEATVVAVDGKAAPNSWFAKNVSTASNNFTNYSNEKFDEIYEQAMDAIDLDKKAELYRQLQKMLAEDAASIYIQDPANLVAVNADLEGYTFYPVSAQDVTVIRYK